VKRTIYLVITEKPAPEGKKDFKKALEWQKRLDEWLISHGATWKSMKHFVTLIGEPTYETCLNIQTIRQLIKMKREARNSHRPQNGEN
jgi:hypothetical protein